MLDCEAKELRTYVLSCACVLRVTLSTCFVVLRARLAFQCTCKLLQFTIGTGDSSSEEESENDGELEVGIRILPLVRLAR